MKISRRYCIILTLLAAIATLVAFAQNAIMFVFGLKEGAIFASPFSFTGVFIGQIALIWTGMFIAIRFAQTKKIPLFAVWCVAVLVVAEFMLPISFFYFQSSGSTELPASSILSRMFFRLICSHLIMNQGAVLR